MTPLAATEGFRATYLIETPLDPAKVADVLAGEQSSGTFVRVAGETDALRARSRAVVVSLEEIEPAATPSLPSAWLARHHPQGPWRRARVGVDFPAANVGRNLPVLWATVAGNLYDLGETTGVRLERIDMSPGFRARFERPRHGIAGTRAAAGVPRAPMVGTILKPNVGLSAAETSTLVAELCRAGVDFIKDDECCGDPEHAPVAERIRAVMAAVRAHRDRTGKTVVMAVHVSDEHDAMLRHAELLQREGGCCAMVSLNWTGPASVQALRRHTDLILHGHRNGYGMWARHPALGVSFQAYAALWRLSGVDHLHVHGLAGKFAQDDDEVRTSARDCLTPLADPADRADTVLPAFSSGQWAGTLPMTLDAVPEGDLLFMAGGGILAHPMGAAAGVQSLRQAADAWAAGRALDDDPPPELRAALDFYAKR
ncbi:MAG: ribulose 1,5-bisphosphate carboxylase [Rubrivivax sp.]|nr:ribulose 1,5-bisphosphate carboxylase [Rubrivivax sp.]